ncbi:hypothetical protein N9X07_03455 [Flavobacteriaceae bacterium]|nr:hypothetical protein [Flavobacteriaceae bacterium]
MSIEIVAEPVLLTKIALAAGLIATEETSAPNAPKAPLNALNLAVPLSDSEEYLNASSMVCAFPFEIDIHTINKNINLIVIECKINF